MTERQKKKRVQKENLGLPKVRVAKTIAIAMHHIITNVVQPRPPSYNCLVAIAIVPLRAAAAEASISAA